MWQPGALGGTQRPCPQFLTLQAASFPARLHTYPGMTREGRRSRRPSAQHVRADKPTENKAAPRGRFYQTFYLNGKKRKNTFCFFLSPLLPPKTKLADTTQRPRRPTTSTQSGRVSGSSRVRARVVDQPWPPERSSRPTPEVKGSACRASESPEIDTVLLHPATHLAWRPLSLAKWTRTREGGGAPASRARGPGSLPP